VAPPIVVAHLSDIHFGRIAHPGIVHALVEEVNGHGADLVAISGDLTQRARPAEYRAAADMIARFHAPTIVVPGNHDVYAWWHPVHRLVRPLGRYFRFVGRDLSPSFERTGLAALGINSAHGRTVKGGRIGSAARASIAAYFRERDPETFKILIVHHHLARIQALGSHDVARKASLTLQVASDVGVDLVLCGHLHVSHIHPLTLIPGKNPLVIASAGTATSSRGRLSNRSTNYYNLVRIEPTGFSIEERRYVPGDERFVAENTTRFDRTGLPG
jgi:3',5'-cyclic AMP phosphodiesterase CpdA